jgi:hypothetical protein
VTTSWRRGRNWILESLTTASTWPVAVAQRRDQDHHSSSS